MIVFYGYLTMTLTPNPFTLSYVTGVIIDRLVKPLRTVVDYNTEFSGITEATLANVTTSLADVRLRTYTYDIPEIINTESYHSLQN